MAHSPFPWKTHPSDRTAVFDSDGLKVAATCAGHAFQSQRLEAEANAALIASIPDMVKALEMIERTSFSGSEMNDDYLRGNREAHVVCAGMARTALAAYRSSQK